MLNKIDLEKQIGGMVNKPARFNLTGHPALSINAGFTEKEKLPVGVQIVGKLFDDVTVLQVAKAFEHQRDIMHGRTMATDDEISRDSFLKS